ncbi:hypothetical protein I5V87_18405 [Stenotrophomonas maltophilia]|nr:hypothetical protein [Stenotrophomonas maltophilia]
MFDVTALLQQFYDEHVRLGGDRRNRLQQVRDLNLAKLNRGLDDLALESGRAKPHFVEAITQGGFAMHTLNQDPAGLNEYDIDVAVIFNSDDLPVSSLAARQRVRDALGKRTEHMKEAPDPRTNAVTLWYQEGYHVDFAVFRRRTEPSGRTVLEHASTDWVERDPNAVNRWFNQSVSLLSPKNESGQPDIRVRPNQFRRIVRFIKWFCKSRESWSLPGGMVVSSLAAECYQFDRFRDDVSLYNTLVSIVQRLQRSLEIENPVSAGVWLTGREENRNQVARLKAQLELIIPKLNILFEPSCTVEKARGAWDWVFNHQYWGEVREEALAASVREDVEAPQIYQLRIRCELARGGEHGEIYGQYRTAQYPLPKGVGLKFTVAATNVPQPYEIAWHIQNSGDEASAAGQLTWDRYNQAECWTSTKYKGLHRMTCEIRRHGAVVAKAHHVVRVRGMWR